MLLTMSVESRHFTCRVLLLLKLFLIIRPFANSSPLSQLDHDPVLEPENVAPQCLQRIVLPEYISQRIAVEDCEDLVSRIIRKPEYRWHDSLSSSLIWRSGTGAPPPGEGRPILWVGEQRLCTFGIRPEPFWRPGGEDTFSVRAVVDAVRAVIRQCANGRLMRNGKQTVGPRRKWAVELEFAVNFPPPSVATGSPLLVAASDKTS